MKNGIKKLLASVLAGLLSVSSLATFAAAEETTDYIYLLNYELEENTGIVIPLDEPYIDLGIAFRRPYSSQEECIEMLEFAEEQGLRAGYAYFEVEGDNRTLILNNFEYDFSASLEIMIESYPDLTPEYIASALLNYLPIPALSDTSGKPLTIESTGNRNLLGSLMFNTISASDLTITGEAPLTLKAGLSEKREKMMMDVIEDKVSETPTLAPIVSMYRLYLNILTSGILLSGYGSDLDISPETSVYITSSGSGIFSTLTIPSMFVPSLDTAAEETAPIVPIVPSDMETDITIKGNLNIDADSAGIYDTNNIADTLTFDSAKIAIKSGLFGICTPGTVDFIDSEVSVTTKDSGIRDSLEELAGAMGGTDISVEEYFAKLGAITASNVSITGGEMTVDSFLNGISAVSLTAEDDSVSNDSTIFALSAETNEADDTAEVPSAGKISVESATVTISSALYAMLAENGISLADCYVADPANAVPGSITNEDGTPLHVLLAADGQPLADATILHGTPAEDGGDDGEETVSPIPNLNLTGIRLIENGKTKTLPSAFGSRRTFTFTPAEGYCVADVLVNGKSVGAVEKYTVVTVPGITVEVIYEELED